MIKGVIFDLDGVIVSTDNYHYLAWKKIADEEGIFFNREINNRLRGVSRMASLNIILERAKKVYSEAEKEALAKKKNELYRASLSSLKPSDILYGVGDLLGFLKNKGIKTAIGSSSKNTKLILSKIGLEDAFDAVADGTMVSHSKPNPEVFLKAAELLSLKPQDCIVVEDAVAGIDAANNGGFISAGVSEAGKYEKADYRLKDISELKTIISKLA